MAKLALEELDNQAVLLKSLKQQTRVMLTCMCVDVFAGHQDVVKVDEVEL